MLTAATALAVALFLIPPIVMVIARARPERSVAATLLDVPFAIAIDLLTVFLAARVMTLESAALVSRPVWLVAGVGRLARRRPGWPRALTGGVMVALAAAALVALALALPVSLHHSIWDRFWHVPLASSLRGQTVPFQNVFDPGVTLHYHFSGDALAAMLQALSFATLHAERALTVAHDLLLALTGVVAAALFVSAGVPRAPMAVARAAAVLLAGPASVLLPAARRHRSSGWVFQAILDLSYRPHACLELLLLVAVAGALLLRLTKERPKESLPLLFAALALLSVTDEISTAELGLALGATWLVEPAIVHPSRRAGALVFAGLAAAVLVPNWLFGASAQPGGPLRSLEWVPARLHGFFDSNDLPLFSGPGMRALTCDFLVQIAAVLALVVAFGRGARGSKERALLILSAGILLFGLVGVSHVEINAKPVESHRFATLGMCLLPLLALVGLAGRAGESPPSRQRFATTGLAMALAVAAASSLDWILSPTDAAKWLVTSGFDTDCRRDLGARVGERARLVYLPYELFGRYSGCHPVLVPGEPPAPQWGIRMEPLLGVEAYRALVRLLPADATLPAICSPRSLDPVCAFALKKGACAVSNPEGIAIDSAAGLMTAEGLHTSATLATCDLTPAVRAGLPY